MIGRRNWALRLSVVLNVCVLLYVCAHFGASGPWIEEPNYVAQVPAEALFSGSTRSNISSSKKSDLASPIITLSSSSSLPPVAPPAKHKEGDGGADEAPAEKEEIKNLEINNQTISSIVASPLRLQDAIVCTDKPLIPRKGQRGDFWVLYNYVPMTRSFHCWESVTYTTHADYTFLDNLEPLLEKWQAPVSIALHAPGTDFAATLKAIRYLRSCGSPLISQLVTFHIYFSTKHMPKSIPPAEKVWTDDYNCTLKAPWVNVSVAKMYKSEKKLLYPVNVGRNIARETATTHFVLASDIELYPSPNLVSKFLEMIRRNDQPALLKPNPKVFVLSIFEVDEKCVPPENKTRLIEMLKKGTAIPFHKKLCSGCHNIPRGKEWQEAPETEGLHVFHVGKRMGNFLHWEPIFIGSNNDPFYDERLSWEGKSDKMTQGYALCVLNYDFLILDNAFLVHRPGIKIYKKDPTRELLTSKTNALIKKVIFPELKILYGMRRGCVV